MAASPTPRADRDTGNGSILSGAALNFTPPGGAAIALDMSNTTQLGAPFVVKSVTVNGNAAAAIQAVQISANGDVNYLLDNGQLASAYRIGVADVAAPTALSNYTGNVYAANGDSGPIFVGAAGAGGRGEIASATLEASTVDLATERSTMIVAQRSYTANTQSFQVASEILQVLNNLK
ncbi:flagellar hook-basal body complex protein [Methylocystis parvus]|uniref:flagellar hook-basal body complex protein n=1 Tax=Methylocystis parvus TaxID=134 RepID=UPI003C754308